MHILQAKSNTNIGPSVKPGLKEESSGNEHSAHGAKALEIARTNRLLFFAPHPDDESLAGGGFLQRAAVAGATVRIVFVTNGENNPWPHRVMERQWRIGGEDRARWGRRRRSEALDALETLGLERTCAHFLNAADQGLTRLLLEQGSEVIAQLRKIIRSFQPTHLIAPARFDLHPDHNALSVLLDSALNSPEFQGLRTFSYAVHNRDSQHAGYREVCLELSQGEQERKRRAIECHRSQMILSKRRFLRHVTNREKFWLASRPPVLDDGHPARFGKVADGVLTLLLRKRGLIIPTHSNTLYLVLRGHDDSYASWKLPLPNKSYTVPVSDTRTSVAIDQAKVQLRRGHYWIHIPLTIDSDMTRIFIKYQPLTLFYDVAGWREIAVDAGAIAQSTELLLKCPAAEAKV